jgi:tetratricopeptide (TPR) repeat protein
MRQFRACAALLLAGCTFGSHRDAGPRGNPDDALQALDEAEAAAQNDPSLLARAGWLRYLIASDPRGAALRFDAAVKSGGPAQRALALAGLGEIAEDRTDSVTAARQFIAALQAAPADPIAELAALRLLDLEGESPRIDELIAGAAQALKPPVAPRAGRLLREAAARISGRRAAAAADPRIESDAWRAIGAVQRWRVGGPFAALRLFDLARALPLDGPTRATAASNDRALEFPDGDVGLDLEPGEGDVYYAVSEVTLARGGEYLLWVEGAAALEARLDGAVAISRVPYPFESPRAQTASVRLAPGVHHVLVRWSRAEGNRFRVTLVRADGDASDLTTAAPKEFSGARVAAPCDLGQPCLAPAAWIDRGDLRMSAAAMLEKAPGDALAAWLLGRAAMGDDRTLSRAAVDRAVALSSSGAPALALRAQQLLHDPEVPDRIGRARALADLGEATRKDPLMIRARLTAAALERDSERFDDAAQDLDKAEAVLREQKAPFSVRVLVARARLLDARGNAAGARGRAEEALKAAPARCDTLQLLMDLSRRDGPVADQRKYAEALVGCNDGVTTAAQTARTRGDLARAEELFRIAASLRPAQPSHLESLADVQSARKELSAAVASLRSAAALAPRSPDPLRRLAGLLELAGEPKAATDARRAALRLAPGDLQVRQQVALDEGVRLLSWSDRDGAALARASRDAPAGASAVRLLDSGATQIFADGGGVERVHTIARVFDKKGIAKFGEAHIPSDAQVVRLRTLKKDGRVLEPESIPEKEGISLPALEPGDAVEIDYLRGLAPRGPDMPGYSLGAFFFRDDETPMGESTYEVRAPAAPEIDAHNLELPPGALMRQADGFRFRYSARDVKALPAEPHQTPESEIMPWVQLGTGAGQQELMRSLADWALLRARPGSATLELAKRSVGVNVPDTARRISASVAQAVRGRSNGTDLQSSAAHVLAQGRGNRLLVLKAALASARIPSHIVFARTFVADPSPHRFPRGDLYGYAVLRIDLPGGPAWVDPSYRLAPFNQLPPFLRGQDGWVVPEPGEEAAQIRLPETLPDQRDGRMLEMDLELDAQGAASGTGRDEHLGFEAASLKDALERLDRDQRKQAVEAMLGRGLRGLTLESLATERETDLGGSATLVYGLNVQVARRDGAQLFVPGSLVPSRLARRWLETAERQVPLLVDAPEILSQRISLALPQGRHLRGRPQPVSLATPHGAYSWSAREEKGKLVIEESLSMPQQRVPPDRYAAFAAFARAVDQAQSQELVIAP